MNAYMPIARLKLSDFFQRMCADVTYGLNLQVHKVAEFRQHIIAAFNGADVIEFQSQCNDETFHQRVISMKTVTFGTITHVCYIPMEYLSQLCYELYEAIQSTYPPEDNILLADLFWNNICENNESAKAYNHIDEWLAIETNWSLLFEGNAIKSHSPLDGGVIPSAWRVIDTFTVARNYKSKPKA